MLFIAANAWKQPDHGMSIQWNTVQLKREEHDEGLDVLIQKDLQYVT